MSIWEQESTIEELNKFNENTMQEVLGITYTDIGDDYLKGTMPVDQRTHQPYGLLHGGATATLAETLGSMAAHLCIDAKRQQAVGIDLHTHHLRGKTSGQVTGIARPLHLGRSTHLWDIKVYDESENLINASQLRMAIIDK